MSTPPRIDLIVPVHRGHASLRRCLERIRAAATRISHELILVDDAAPEPEIQTLLRAQSGMPGTTLLVNPVNLGFVASVNRAAALHPDRDLVLLNSDTQVHGDWLERLTRCAAAHPGTATLTPFSNNATICSYPLPMRDNPLPAGLDLARLDTLFARANAGQAAELPTGVGFCLWVARAAWTALGGFDAARFGRGYGEENDFCRRATAAGWHNRLCAELFVFHEGGVSFGAERLALQQEAHRRLLACHPDYDAIIAAFRRRDPLHPLRRSVDEARIDADPLQARIVLDEHDRGWQLERQAGRAAQAAALRHARALRRECDARERRYDRQLSALAAQIQTLHLGIADHAAALERAEGFVRERERELADTRSRLERLATECMQLHERLSVSSARADALQRQIALIHASRSWRYTRFLRKT